jgi:hypothetical protein
VTIHRSLVIEKLPEHDAPTDRPIYFADELGCAWSAREVDGTRVPGGRGARCLILESVRAVHRVWRFPVAWRALPHAGLIDLLAAR